MTINTTAKSRVFIGSVSDNTIAALLDFEGVDWIEIKEVEDLGEAGPEGSIQTFLSMADGYVRKLKGSIDSGTIELVVGRDPADPGQNKAREAVADWNKYPIKIELNDKPTPTGENTLFYFRAVVASARNNFGNADNITRTTISLAIDGQILELPAEPVVTFSPAAGALTGGTEGIAYTATVTASGGIGTVSYAVTSGTLPAGLSLNSASGAITGTPSADGTSAFTITATYDGAGEESAAYSIVIAPA